MSMKYAVPPTARRFPTSLIADLSGKRIVPSTSRSEMTNNIASVEVAARFPLATPVSPGPEANLTILKRLLIGS